MSRTRTQQQWACDHQESVMDDRSVRPTSAPLRQKQLARKLPRHLLRQAFSIIGGIANLLGIYGFCESRHWWGLSLPALPEMTHAGWMIAVGVGGPWAMILGAAVGAKVLAHITSNNTLTKSIIHAAVEVGFFF